jgi:hypothetical protein
VYVPSFPTILLCEKLSVISSRNISLDSSDEAGNLLTVSGLLSSWVLVSPFVSRSTSSSSLGGNSVVESGSASCSIVYVSDKLDSSYLGCVYINQHIRISVRRMTWDNTWNLYSCDHLGRVCFKTGNGNVNITHLHCQYN